MGFFIEPNLKEEVSMGGCCGVLSNTLCDMCKDKKWVDQDKKYFCKKFNTNLERLDGDSGGAVKTMQCAVAAQRPGRGVAKGVRA
ncbi:MAG: hypothetical protein LBQ94_03265 [Treponema sp.]|jgi:hypothetical protein|nr:hypothetical protein [Treponema sp.]